MFIYDKENRLNINFDDNLPKEKPDIQTWKDIYGTHAKIGDKVYGDYPNVTKLANFLYFINIDEVDEEYAYKYADKISNGFGACTSIRKGDFFGRNYDWYYSNQVSWVVKTNAKPGRFESIGLASCPVLRSQVEDKQYIDQFKLIPFQTLDGINENYVTCSMNVTSEDYRVTTGTNPGKPDLYNIFICRYILDNALNARHGVDLLKERNIKSIFYDGTHIELHILIADLTSTYIVEFKNNKMVILSDQDDQYENIPADRAIMTNFHLSGVKVNDNGTVYTSADAPTHKASVENGIALHGSGLERYNLAVASYDSINTVTKMKNLMKSLYYTKAYPTATTVSNPFWYSEFVEAPVSQGSSQLLTVDSPTTDFNYVLGVVGPAYTNRDRTTPYQGIKTWQTVHSSVYDIPNKKLYLRVQEEDTEYTFDL